MKRALVIGGALAAIAVASPATAQVTVGVDAAVFSSYVWRGLSLTNKPVFEPDVYLTIPVGGAAFTAGGWANIDIGKYDDPNNDISESGGTSKFNFAEFDWWGELAIPVGKLTVTPGVTGYLYPNKNCGVCLMNNIKTVEIYTKLTLDAPLSPKLNAYYDAKAVKGIYLEGSLAHSVQVTPAVPLTIGALIGYSNAEGPNPKDISSDFAKNGFTHLDLSLASSFSAGPLSFTPAVHGVFGLDDAVKVTKPTATNTKFKLWGGVTISWSKAFGGEAAAE